MPAQVVTSGEVIANFMSELTNLVAELQIRRAFCEENAEAFKAFCDRKNTSPAPDVASP